MPDSTPSRRFRFGVFEADEAAAEVRRKGIRVKLNAQPFQLLILLLENPGELLTRNQIAAHLWPSETFVDFDHGVNSAINRIREALGDTASNPRFVETLARRGYRFIAPVELVSSASQPTETIAPEPLTTILATAEDLPHASHTVTKSLLVALQLMYVGFYGGALSNLPEIADLLSPVSHASAVFATLIATAAVLIPVRAFILTGALLHPPEVRTKLLRLWPYVLPFDILWSLAPFLLLHHINFGVAIACTPLLVYSPFAQRSLILMGAAER
jgi:cholera toxin transcriptional activator